MSKEDLIYYINEAVKMLEFFVTFTVAFGAIGFLWLKGLI